MIFEIAVPMRDRPRGIALADPSLPLAPAPGAPAAVMAVPADRALEQRVAPRDEQPFDDSCRVTEERLEEEHHAHEQQEEERNQQEQQERGRRLQERLEQEQALIEQTATSLQDLADDLLSQQRQRLAEMQHVAGALAVAVAEHFIHERIESGCCAVENLVQQVVGSLEGDHALRVYLHPDDISLLEARRQPIFAEDSRIRLLADPLLARGHCRAETADGNIAAQFEEQIAGLRRQLLGRLPDVEVERRAAAGQGPLSRYPSTGTRTSDASSFD